MIVIITTPGRCALCAGELFGPRCSRTTDGALVHTRRCLLPFICGCDPVAVQRYRRPHYCAKCRQVHAEVCP